MPETKMPKCVGTFEARDVQCDGRRAAAKESERLPCSFRDRCVALQKLTEIVGRPIEFFVQHREVAALSNEKKRLYAFPARSDLMDKLAKVQVGLGIRNGRATKKLRKKRILPQPVLSKKARASLSRNGKKQIKVAIRGARRKSIERTAAVTALAQWYTTQLTKQTGVRIANSRANAQPGEMFLIDRTEKCNYVAVYQRTKGTTKSPLTSIYFRPASGRLELRIAIGFDTLRESVSAATWKRLDPQDYTGKDGAFKVRVKAVDSELATIVAETIARLFKKGLFKAPGEM